MQSGVRAKKACELAGIDPGRFNEMVHSGHFPCAPETRPGSARIFDLDQIVALQIFGDLLSLQMPPNRAGQIACSAYSIFAGKQDVDRLVLRKDAFGEWTVEVENAFHLTVNSSPTRTVFDISEHRERIGDLLEWEQTFGSREDNA